MLEFPEVEIISQDLPSLSIIRTTSPTVETLDVPSGTILVPVMGPPGKPGEDGTAGAVFPDPTLVFENHLV